MQKGRCKHCHHEGLEVLCSVGKDIRAMVREACNPGEDPDVGFFFRLPCDSVEWTRKQKLHTPKTEHMIAQKPVCDKFEDPTDEEIAAYKRETQFLIQRMEKAFELTSRLKAEHRGGAWAGVEVCPACGGKLGVSIATNGHCWGRCETEGCLAWME